MAIRRGWSCSFLELVQKQNKNKQKGAKKTVCCRDGKIIISRSINSEPEVFTSRYFPAGKSGYEQEYATPDLFTMEHWHGEISSNMNVAHCTKGGSVLQCCAVDR